MIVKERTIPIKIRKLKALLRRLSSNHIKRPEIEEELAMSSAGYKGEKSLDYYLSFLSENHYYIFHDLRLPFNNYFFQLDVLILSPTYFLIIEVKNIIGTLVFDPTFNQFIRILNGIETGMPDPVLQVSHQQFQLLHWLKQHKCPSMPIETMVVMTNANSILKIADKNPEYTDKILRSPKLLPKINALTTTIKENPLTEKEIKKISKLLTKNHVPYDIDILNHFNIKQHELMTGVICPNCSFLPMQREWGKWYCPSCTFSSKVAHHNALNDYFLLLRQTITNQQLRDFLKMPTVRVANYLLNEMNLPHFGVGKGRYYLLSEQPQTSEL